MKESPEHDQLLFHSQTKNAEKAFDKIQHPFMIETLQKVGIEGTYLNIPEAIYDSHSHLRTQTVKSWKPSLQYQKQGWPLLPLLFNIVLKSYPQQSDEKKEQKESKLERKK